MIIEILDFGYEKKPERAHFDDAGIDVYTAKEAKISANTTAKIGLGFGVKIPQGFAGYIFPRSGKTVEGLICQLPPIDSGYRGEINAIVLNVTGEDRTIPAGTKIGQLVIMPVIQAELKTAEEMSELERRGNGAFGSTDGKK